MAFFTSKQKRLAKKSDEELTRNYRLTELKLKQAAATGNERELKKLMAEHRQYEYARLYKETPKFKKGSNKNVFGK